MPSNRVPTRRTPWSVAVGLGLGLITSGVRASDSPTDPLMSPEGRSLFPSGHWEAESTDSTAFSAWTAFLTAGLDRVAGRSDAALVHLRSAGSAHPEVRLELASIFYERGEIDSAIVHAEYAARELPESVEPCLILGRSYLSRGGTDAAIEWLQEAHRRSSEDPRPLLSLLAALQRAGRHAEALALLEPAIPENLATGSLYATRASLRLNAGRRLEAIEDLAVAIEKDPSQPGFVQGLVQEISRLSDPLEAVPALERLRNAAPDVLPAQRALVGILATSPRWKEAIAPLERLIALDETDVRSRVQLGLLLTRDGQDEAAEREWIKATRIDPEDPEAWRWLCRKSATEENWTLLSSRADSLRARAPDDGESWWFTGVARYQEGDYSGSLEALRKVLDKDPEHREACLLASSLLLESGEVAEAETRLRRFVDGHPRDVGALYRWGVALEQVGKFDESVRVFDRLLEIEPRHDAALNYVGYMCIDRGVNVAEGVARAERALEIDPDNAAYLDSVGWGYRVLGRPAEAVLHLEKAVKATGHNATILKHLGIVYQELGRTEEAIEIFQRARLADPEDTDVRSRLATLKG